MPRALAPRGTNGNSEFIPMTAHVDVKCMLRRYLHLSATDPLLVAVRRFCSSLICSNLSRSSSRSHFNLAIASRITSSIGPLTLSSISWVISAILVWYICTYAVRSASVSLAKSFNCLFVTSPAFSLVLSSSFRSTLFQRLIP